MQRPTRSSNENNKSLEELRESLDLYKANINRLTGQKESLLEQLKTEYNIAPKDIAKEIASAKKKLEAVVKDREQIAEDAKTLLTEMQERVEQWTQRK